jgi:hypothetical protein
LRIEQYERLTVSFTARWHNRQVPVLAPKGATPVTVEQELVTRGEVRQMGLGYSNSHFLRLEKKKLLTPVKPGGFRSSRVHYRVEQVRDLIDGKSRR